MSACMPCLDFSISTEHLIQSLCSLKGHHEEEVGPTRSDGGKKGVGRLLLDAKWLCTCMWHVIM